MTIATKRKRMTDAEITAVVRRYNPLIHGRRDDLLRLREKIAKAGASPLELSEIDAEITKWEARIARLPA